MPKLCQCRRKKLLDKLWDIPDPYEDLVERQLEDIEKILESDCVCEKKDEKIGHGIVIPREDKAHYKELINNLVKSQSREKKEEEKCLCTQYHRTLKCPVHHPEWSKYLAEQEKSQSSEKKGAVKECGCVVSRNCKCFVQKQNQSPCQHKEWGSVETADGHPLVPEVWVCANEKCGLVTCLDPNDK